MASGTVAIWLETNLNPKQEVVVLEDVSDGNIYTSRKFATLAGGHISSNNTNNSGSVSMFCSGSSATIYCDASITSGTYTVTLFGE